MTITSPKLVWKPVVRNLRKVIIPPVMNCVNITRGEYVDMAFWAIQALREKKNVGLNTLRCVKNYLNLVFTTPKDVRVKTQVAQISIHIYVKTCSKEHVLVKNVIRDSTYLALKNSNISF